MKTLRLLLVFAVTVMPHGQMLFAQEMQQNWPREIDIPEADIVMYQPQLESFKGDHLTARAAVSVTPKGETEPTFGAVWMEARVTTDRNTRTVKCLQVDVTQAKFPNADPAKVDKLKKLLSSEIPKWDMTISLDRLLTMLDLVEKEQKAAGQLETTPPEIMIVEHPAILISIDGKPILDKVEGSDLMRVVNTPFFIVLDPGSKQYYLKGDNWLSAKELEGPWKETESVPETVLAEAAKSEGTVGDDSDESSGDQKPQVIVVTEPTELIVLDGKAEYTPISGANLLYVSNTDRDIFMDIDSQRHYILLSGRWYSSKSLDGKKWKYISGDKLPEGFAKIPGGSAKENVLASVPETVEANEAILETYIPQTSTIVRDEAKLDVTYDGTPEFESIKGTDMSYAINTPNAVIQYDNSYYCCNEGVWFVSGNAQGPWVVCDAVPDAIYTIPPSYPIYNVKYVYVYGSTPTVVYMGYTPGYTGSYAYGGTVVYGTGYVYPGWHGTHYYPYPVTYGYAPVYQPYSGWSFAAGLAVGWIASRAYHGGWWGSHGYRDVRYSHNVNINRNIYNRPGGGRPGGGRPGDRPGRPGGGRPGDRPGRPGGDRPGDRPGRPGGDRPVTGRPGGDRPGTGRPGESRPGTRPSTRPETKRPNNVYSDRNGKIHRRTDSGWQKRDSQGWSQQKRTPTSDRSRPTQQRRPSNLDRQHSARQRGTARTNNYQRSRGSGGGGRSRGSAPSRGGGSRGGGGRGGGSRGGGSRGGGGRGGGGRGGRR